MTLLEQQIVDTWNIHHRITMFFIEHLPDDALKSTLSTRGGRDIARQLAHVNNVRTSWVESFAKKNGLKLIGFDKEESPPKKKLLEAFKLSGDAIAKYVEDAIAAGGEVKGFKRGVVPMIGYLISHEAHHRGHVLLTMKQSGHKMPDELKWGIWDWNKM